MSEYGSITKENVVVLPGKEKKKFRSLEKYLPDSNDQEVLEINFDEDEHPLIRSTDELRDFDSDSGVSSIPQMRGKIICSTSRSSIPLDDDDVDRDRLGQAMSSSLVMVDLDERRNADATSNTDLTTNQTVSDYFPNSRKTSQKSTELNEASATGGASLVGNQRTTIQNNVVENKSKTGVRKFIQRILGRKSKSETIPRSILVETAPIQEVANERVGLRRSPPCITQGPIRLLVIRHGERLDRYYSSQWLRQAFDKDGNFCRFSPILPETLPFRASIRDFDLDPPLTYKGLKDAFHTGTVLRDKNIQINYCYSSPALRCVQTAAKILEGLQLHNKIKIRLEPGLFECTGWYTVSETNQTLAMPRFLTKREFIENKYFIDKNYREQLTYSEVSQLESDLEFYQRNHSVTASILNMHENEFIAQIQEGHATIHQNLHILFIAHAPSLETCTRKLCGGKFRPETLGHVIRNVDFLTMTVIEKTDNTSDKWIFRRSSFYGDEF